MSSDPNPPKASPSIWGQGNTVEHLLKANQEAAAAKARILAEEEAKRKAEADRVAKLTPEQKSKECAQRLYKFLKEKGLGSLNLHRIICIAVTSSKCVLTFNGKSGALDGESGNYNNLVNFLKVFAKKNNIYFQEVIDIDSNVEKATENYAAEKGIKVGDPGAQLGCGEKKAFSLDRNKFGGRILACVAFTSPNHAQSLKYSVQPNDIKNDEIVFIPLCGSCERCLEKRNEGQ